VIIPPTNISSYTRQHKLWISANIVLYRGRKNLFVSILSRSISYINFQSFSYMLMPFSPRKFLILFAEIADAYFEREMYAEAKPIYELLGGDSTVCQNYFQVQYPLI
jgi:hypothetical protein